MYGLRFFLLLISWNFVISMIMVATVLISGYSVQG